MLDRAWDGVGGGVRADDFLVIAEPLVAEGAGTTSICSEGECLSDFQVLGGELGEDCGFTENRQVGSGREQGTTGDGVCDDDVVSAFVGILAIGDGEVGRGGTGDVAAILQRHAIFSPEVGEGRAICTGCGNDEFRGGAEIAGE